MSKIDFFLGYDNLKDVPFEKYEHDFTFIVDGKPYSTPRIVADLLSPKIRKMHFADESVNEFHITTDDKNGDDHFKDFLSLVNFDKIQLDASRVSSFSSYFKQLDNTDSHAKLSSEFLSELTTENAVSRLRALLKQTGDNSDDSELTDNLLLFISSHFYELKASELSGLPPSVLHAIVSSECLRISDEDALLEIVLGLYEEDRSCACLLACVAFSNVSDEMFAKFAASFAIDDMTTDVWRAVCARGACCVRKIGAGSRYLKLNDAEFAAEDGHEFEGIMRHLCDVSGGNIHDKGAVEITSNSIYGSDIDFHPKNLVDYGRGSYYENSGSPDSFVCFDFKDRRVQLSAYAIRSRKLPQGSCHLKSWAVEVSDDGFKWEAVDTRSNDSTLNGSNATAVFQVKSRQKGFRRFIRLHQTGQGWGGNFYIHFCLLEFFGKIEFEK